MAKKIKIKVEKSKNLDSVIQYYQSGHLQQAEAVCRQILFREPNNPDGWHLLGLIAIQSGRYDSAIDYINKAVCLAPQVYTYYYNLGNTYAFKGLMEEAIVNFRKTIELRPDYTEAYINIGNALKELGMIEGAIEFYKKALVLNPDFAVTYYNLGNILFYKGMTEEAIDNYKKAIALKPDYFEAYNNLGYALFDKDMIDEAIENYKKTLALNPDYAEAYNNLGLALENKNLIDESIEAIKKALTLNPNHIYAHTNLGAVYLFAKNFDKGWEEYEWRLKTIKVPPLAKPGWDGSSLEGKVILVYAEQGYGDALQFVRYLPLLYDESGAKKVLFIAPKGLEELLKESDLKAKILDAGISVESLEYDTNIHLLSLPRIFKTNLENIPFKGKRYLKANTEKVEWYRERFFDPTPYTLHPTPFNIGIFWQGNPELKPDRNRSMPLHHFYPLCRLPNIKVYSLQKGYGTEQLNNLPEDVNIINLGETFNDFSDTAAAIENLDLMITVDTAIGHLSGALGKQTWILLPSHAEWRWHLDMNYSPWYEDVKLFRHKELGKKDWEEVMRQVEVEVEEEIGN